MTENDYHKPYKTKWAPFVEFDSDVTYDAYLMLPGGKMQLAAYNVSKWDLFYWIGNYFDSFYIRDRPFRLLDLMQCISEGRYDPVINFFRSDEILRVFYHTEDHADTYDVVPPLFSQSQEVCPPARLAEWKRLHAAGMAVMDEPEIQPRIQ